LSFCLFFIFRSKEAGIGSTVLLFIGGVADTGEQFFGSVIDSSKKIFGFWLFLTVMNGTRDSRVVDTGDKT
jgi:hypothetical protein